MTESQEQNDGVTRCEQIFAVPALRHDREKGIIYRVHALGLQSKHGYRYDEEATRAVTYKFESLPVGIDHDRSGGPLTVGATFGTLRNPVYEPASGVFADLHYLTTHEQAPKIVEDLERTDTRLFALSMVNGRVIEKNKVITSFVPLRCDVVTGGATTSTLLEQAPVEPPVVPAVDPVVAAPVVDPTVVLREQVESLTAKLSDLEKRLTLHEQFVQPTVTETIKTATTGIDLTKYWNDFAKKDA